MSDTLQALFWLLAIVIAELLKFKAPHSLLKIWEFLK